MRKQYTPPIDVLKNTDSLGSLTNTPNCSTLDKALIVTLYCVLGFNPCIL